MTWPEAFNTAAILVCLASMFWAWAWADRADTQCSCANAPEESNDAGTWTTTYHDPAVSITDAEAAAAQEFFNYGATRGNHADDGRGPYPGPLTPHIQAMTSLVLKLRSLVTSAPENVEAADPPVKRELCACGLVHDDAGDHMTSDEFVTRYKAEGLDRKAVDAALDRMVAGGTVTDAIRTYLAHVSPAAPTSPAEVGQRFTFEPHGDGWAVYEGRTDTYHGLNLATVETEADAKYLAEYLTRLAQPAPVPPVTAEDVELVRAKIEELAEMAKPWALDEAELLSRILAALTARGEGKYVRWSEGGDEYVAVHPAHPEIESVAPTPGLAALGLIDALADLVTAGFSDYAALRPEVLAFARLMEAKLRKHDAERGQSWKQDHPLELASRLEEEVRELEGTLGPSGGDIAGEAADVANFAMMIADVCEALGTAPLATPALTREQEDRLRSVLLNLAAPMEGFLSDTGSHKYVAPEVLSAMQAALADARATLAVAPTDDTTPTEN